MRREKRSVMRAEQQLDWVGFDQVQGVGARQAGGAPPPGGGGYLHECTPPQLFAEARFRELGEMGLPAVWLRVAREIGYERFMAMWRILDASIELRSESDSMIEVQLRRYASFQRFQRNRFIEALSQFLTPAEIRARVKVELGENLSLHHVRRLANRRRVDPA